DELTYKKQLIATLKKSLEMSFGNDYDIIAGADITDQNLDAFIKQYNQAVSEYGVLSRNWGKAHPQLLEKESEIASIRKRILDAADKVLKNLNREMSQVLENERDVTERIRKAPQIDKEIKDVNR